MDYQKIFSQNIVAYAKKQNLSLSKLAQKAGISYPTIISISHNEYNPSLQIMNSIASALDIPLSMLLSESSNTETNSIDDPIVPKGYKWVKVLLSDFEAFKVNLMHENNMRKIFKTSK